jgi:hypothetical protein
MVERLCARAGLINASMPDCAVVTARWRNKAAKST